MRETHRLWIVAVALCILSTACSPPQPSAKPAIQFTSLPPSGEGSPDRLYEIAGKVEGARPDQKIVLYARAGQWWVQPMADDPLTRIESDSTWKNVTHPGSAYAALLVGASYKPPATMQNLPRQGGDVMLVAVAEGQALAQSSPKTIHFSGYEWEVRQASSNRAGTHNDYDPENVFVDDRGFLHLRLARKEGRWTSAEVRLARSLGYGSYRVVVRETSHLEPAAVFSMFTWSDSGSPREMDIEISRWGEPGSRNAQYVIQPYYIPANAVRFEAPSGVLTHSFRWEPGRVVFRTLRGTGSQLVDEHAFTSGVPAPGEETVRLNLYRFENRRHPLQRECEVIVEAFEYLP